MTRQTTDDRLQEFRDALVIDRNRMDDMLMEQASLFHEVSDEHAMAVSRRDQAKAELEETTSKTYLRLRKENRDEKDKASETTLKHMTETDDDVQDAHDKYLNLKRVADRWEALTTGFKDRSYMLRELAQNMRSEFGISNSAGKTADRAGASTRIAEQNKAEAGEKRHR